MSDAIVIFKQTSKSDLIKGYREWLRQNKKWGTRKEGFKQVSDLKRPKINNVHMSWTEFRRLPKESIVVHIFTEGCNAEFLTALKEAGFYTKPTPLAKKPHSRFVYYPKGPNQKKGYHWCEKKCCGQPFMDKDYILYSEAVEYKIIKKTFRRMEEEE